jgi:predicted ABC-class ATPase
MVRDSVMRRLVPDDAEPITPFIDRVRDLYDEQGISTILVMGGAGDYFGVADTVIWMNEYEPTDVSERARFLVPPRVPAEQRFPGVVERVPEPTSIDPTRRSRTRTRARGTEEIGFGEDLIDLRQVEQIVDSSQTRGIAEILVYAVKMSIIDGERSVQEFLDEVEAILNREPIDVFSQYRGHPGDFARPRRYEIGAALNRLRSLRVRQRA